RLSPASAEVNKMAEQLQQLVQKSAETSTTMKGLVEWTNGLTNVFLISHPALAGFIDAVTKGDPALQSLAKGLREMGEALQSTRDPAQRLRLITDELNALYANSERGNPDLEKTIHNLENRQTLTSREVDDKFQQGLKDAADAARKAIDEEWASYQQLIRIAK